MKRAFVCINGVFRGVLSVVAVTAAAFAGSGPAFGQCQYSVTILEGPECSPGEPVGFGPADIDEEGNMAGASSCFILPRAAAWDGGPSAFFLSGPPSTSQSQAFGLAGAEHIVGIARPSGQTLDIAAYWQSGQGALLGTLPGANTSVALGINPALEIVGYTNDTLDGPLQAFQWQNGVMTAIQLPLGPNGRANDVNAIGQVTGWMGNAPFDSNAYIWHNGEVTDLGKIPGGNSAEGIAISSVGHVVGRGWVPVEGSLFGEPHAMYWDGQSMVDLGLLPGHTSSTAYDLNDVDQIVGRSFDSETGGVGVIWLNGQIYDLNDLIVSDIEGLRITITTAINNQGVITAGSNHGGVFLTPIGSAPGDIDNNCTVNVDDLLMVLTEWGKSPSVADVNDDGVVNVTDLLQLLADWG